MSQEASQTETDEARRRLLRSRRLALFTGSAAELDAEVREVYATESGLVYETVVVDVTQVSELQVLGAHSPNSPAFPPGHYCGALQPALQGHCRPAQAGGWHCRGHWQPRPAPPVPRSIVLASASSFVEPPALLLVLPVFPVDRMSHVFECCHLGRCLLQRLRLTRRSTRRSQLSFVTVWGQAPPRAPASSSRRAAAPQHQALYARHLLRHGPSRVTILSTRLRQRSPTLSCGCHPAATLPYLPPTLLPHHPITNLLPPLP